MLARYEALQRTQRNILGEELGPLSSKELESFDRQLDSWLKLVRSSRTQYMLDQLNDLQRKMNPGAEEEIDFSRQLGQHHGDTFFQPFPMDCEPTLQIGYSVDPALVATPVPVPLITCPDGWLP